MADNEDAASATLVAEGGDEVQNKLCTRCEPLDLTVDKFAIANATTTSHISQDSQRSESKSGGVNFRLKSGRNFKSCLQQLRTNRRTCRFCDLLCRAIEHYSHGNIDDTTTCSLRWEVDGRQLGSTKEFVNSTRRVRLSWQETTGNGQEVYLVYVAPRDPLRPNSDATSRWQRETHFLGREFGDQKEKQALIKSWLDLCVNEHKDACRDTHGTEREFMDLIKETYFGVIDVTDMQLTQLPVKKGKPASYVALSYVWGEKPYDRPPYVTTRANVLMHIMHGGIEKAWDELPITIQDAILLVGRLGQRYIWIDSLCIVQDSDSSWQLNARAMHLVYGNAHFTICAADGDSSTGLRAVKPILQAVRPGCGISQQWTSARLMQAEDDGDAKHMSAECAPGVRLMVTRPLEAVVNESMWNQRAWTFQERVLSRRCLVFAEGRVYFQCRSTGVSQDIHTDGRANGWSLDRINSRLWTLMELQQRPLWFYMKYVSMYTGRQLTKPGDILAAFEGISWLLDRYMRAPSLFGLPTSVFDLALLWSPSESVSHRRPRVPQLEDKACTRDKLGNGMCKVDKQSFGPKTFPTWSWAGWMGGRIEYQTGMIDGCVPDVQQWLMYHTWIQWYIRDAKGHLRPLWEILSHRTDRRTPQGMDEDWGGQGYPCTGFERHETYRERRRTLTVPAVIPETWEAADDTSRRRQRRGSSSSSHRSHYGDGRDREAIIIRDDPQPAARREEIVIRRRSPSPDGDEDSPIRTPRRSPQVRIREPSEHLRQTHHAYYDSDEEVEEDVGYRNGISDRHHPSPPGSDRERSHSASSEEVYDGVLLRVSNRSYRIRAKSSGAAPVKNRPVINEHYTRYRSHSGPSRDFWPGSDRPVDRYGRVIRGEVPNEDNPRFDAILPDNPFGVIRDHSDSSQQTPVEYMPVLQFWTWRTELHVTVRDPVADGTSVKQPNTGLCQCDVVDKEGDWCGAIVLDYAWIRERQGHIFQFIALSDAKAFTKDECPTWNYYIPKEYDESEWDLYYVLLLQRNAERGLWERGGLGKVFQVAFREKTWAEIKLG